LNALAVPRSVTVRLGWPALVSDRD